MANVKVAFICTHNSCRSQIAEGIGNAMFAEELECYSAGTDIAEQINPDAVRLMQDYYVIDLSQQSPKKLEALPPVDVVVTMGCGVQCPTLPCKEQYDWGLEDPTGKGDFAFLQVMREIEKKMAELVIQHC